METQNTIVEKINENDSAYLIVAKENQTQI
jgi:hypothetical protein